MRGNKRLETAPAEIAIFCFTVITVLSPRRKKNKKVKQKNLRSSVIRESPCFRFVRSSCSGERLTRCVAFPSEYCGDLRKGSAWCCFMFMFHVHLHRTNVSFSQNESFKIAFFLLKRNELNSFQLELLLLRIPIPIHSASTTFIFYAHQRRRRTWKKIFRSFFLFLLQNEIIAIL